VTASRDGSERRSPGLWSMVSAEGNDAEKIMAREACRPAKCPDWGMQTEASMKAGCWSRSFLVAADQYLGAVGLETARYLGTLQTSKLGR